MRFSKGAGMATANDSTRLNHNFDAYAVESALQSSRHGNQASLNAHSSMGRAIE